MFEDFTLRHRDTVLGGDRYPICNCLISKLVHWKDTVNDHRAFFRASFGLYQSWWRRKILATLMLEQRTIHSASSINQLPQRHLGIVSCLTATGLRVLCG